MAETNAVIDIQQVIKGFDPNTDADGKAVAGGAILPTVNANGRDIELGLSAYMKLAGSVLDGESPAGTFLEMVQRDFQKATMDDWERIKQAQVTAKAVDIPANFMTYGRMSYMPDSTTSNMIPWPGVHPEALRKIIRENVAPNLIIGTRCDDMMQYAQLSQHLWRPGWRIELFQGDKAPTSSDRTEMREAERFLQNSSSAIKYDEAVERDTENLTDFHRFLVAITRDSLSFDLIAISTDRDSAGRVVQYAPVPAGNIRLIGEEGYEGNKEIYAVAVDEGGAIKRTYTRNDLLLYSRNVRTDPEYSVSLTRGYGTPEVETALKLIQIFQNVLDFNSDVFQRSGVPHGLLLLTGNGWTQKQVDVLTRMWHNLKRGISKVLALPVLAAPKDGKVEVVDFSRIKGDEAFYQDLLNLSIGCFCAVFRFPVNRLGYRISGGHGQDTRRHGDRQTPGALIDDEDPGRVALLVHIENLVNQYLVCPRWPNLRMRFTGKEPKADAREYEGRKNAQTWGEARAEADLPKLSSLVSDADLKKLCEVMEVAPIDPNLSGVFQSVASAFFKPAAGEGEPGNTMNSTQDPAAAEHHGKVSGVRRDSADEKGKTAH